MNATTSTTKPPAFLGEFRNVYRRADGTLRYGCTWRDAETAAAMREILLYEEFVEVQDMRDVGGVAPARAPGASA